MAAGEPHVTELSPDHQLIAICRGMLIIHQEQDALMEQDPNAPDRGPNHGRHEALSKAFAALAAALTEAAPPTPAGGARLSCCEAYAIPDRVVDRAFLA